MRQAVAFLVSLLLVVAAWMFFLVLALGAAPAKAPPPTVTYECVEKPRGWWALEVHPDGLEVPIAHVHRDERECLAFLETIRSPQRHNSRLWP